MSATPLPSLSAYMHLMAQRKASDLFFSVGAPPAIKIEGHTFHIDQKSLEAEDVRLLAYALMTEKQQREFESTMEVNLGVGLPNAGRFRVNIYRQRGCVAMAIRFVTSHIPAIEDLNLPLILRDFVMLPRGLVLVVGGTGSGKSTTLASMIDYRNQRRTGHILTVEEPIEFLHQHKKCIIDQREVGIDTLSYENALKNAMRAAPDVIMVGEIRDRNTMQAAISYAETGHLCLSTLHANNANQTLDRIINFFPETARHQLLVDLSLNLRAVVSLRLMPGVNEKRVPAVEIMHLTPFISDLILKGEIAQLKDAMKAGREVGMQTFDESIYRHYASGKVSYATAIEYADSRTDLALRIRLEGPAPPADHVSDIDSLSLQT